MQQEDEFRLNIAGCHPQNIGKKLCKLHGAKWDDVSERGGKLKL